MRGKIKNRHWTFTVLAIANGKYTSLPEGYVTLKCPSCKCAVDVILKSKVEGVTLELSHVYTEILE